jgi:triosephosphate isomerase (TIM)
MRRPYLAANWKMNKTVAETEAFFGDFLPQLGEVEADVVVCTPFTSLGPAVDACEGTPVRIAAQNMHEADSGAYTGEVSAEMLTELGVRAVVLGHSERREYFNETDEALARKVVAALDAGLEPILCVGESDAEREAGETAAVLTRQIEADLADVDDARLGSLVIAYEPVWAIGTGKTASTEQAQEACAQIRELIAGRSAEAAAELRILYGGSMKPANAGELIAQEDVDGGLVGGASLDAEDFLAIVEAAPA